MGLRQVGEREICAARFECVSIPPRNCVDSIFACQDVEVNGTKHDSSAASKFQSFFSHGEVKWESNNACFPCTPFFKEAEPNYEEEQGCNGKACEDRSMKEESIGRHLVVPARRIVSFAHLFALHRLGALAGDAEVH